MTKHRDRMIAKGKETQLMKSERLRKEKLMGHYMTEKEMEQDRLKQDILDTIKKEDEAKKKRFETILWMAENHPVEKLESMLGQAYIPYLDTHDGVKVDILCAYVFNRISFFTKELEEIKQCLNGKQDKFNPDLKRINPFEALDRHTIIEPLKEEKKDE